MAPRSASDDASAAAPSSSDAPSSSSAMLQSRLGRQLSRLKGEEVSTWTPRAVFRSMRVFFLSALCSSPPRPRRPLSCLSLWLSLLSLALASRSLALLALASRFVQAEGRMRRIAHRNKKQILSSITRSLNLHLSLLSSAASTNPPPAAPSKSTPGPPTRPNTSATAA